MKYTKSIVFFAPVRGRQPLLTHYVDLKSFPSIIRQPTFDCPCFSTNRSFELEYLRIRRYFAADPLLHEACGICVGFVNCNNCKDTLANPSKF